MQKSSAAVLLGALCVFGLEGCGGADDTVGPEDTTAPPAAGTGPVCEIALFYQQELENLRSRFDETHPDVVRVRELAEMAEAACSGPAATANPEAGEWVQKDGALVCDGYMIRRADLDYCSSTVPGDWVPFEFDGETYFLQPLHSVPPAPSTEK